MKTSKRALLMVIALALVVLTTGCFNLKMNFTTDSGTSLSTSLSTSTSTAKITDAIMTESVDANGVPGAAVTSYPADTAMLYTSAKLVSAPNNTQIRIVWTYVTSSQTVDTVTIDSGTIADRYIYSSLKPDLQLPEGDYKVDYYIGESEQPAATVTFTVTAPTVSDVSTLVKEAHMTSFVDENGLPVNTISTVPTKGTWYVAATLSKPMPDSVITFYWFDLNDKVMNTVELQGSSELNVSAAFQLTDTVPEGEYHVAIYVGTADKPSLLINFNASNNA